MTYQHPLLLCNLKAFIPVVLWIIRNTVNPVKHNECLFQCFLATYWLEALIGLTKDIIICVQLYVN